VKTNLMGLIRGQTNADYHSNTLYLSSTGLREFAKSPAHYEAYLAGKRKHTAQMFFGTNFHELVGEPQLFAAKYTKGLDKADYPNALFTVADITAKIKAIDPNAKVGKSKPEAIKMLLEMDPNAVIWDVLVERHEAANVGKIVLSAEDYDRLDGMLYSLVKNRTALALLSGGESEVSIYWQDPKTGVLLRCRPDYLRSDGVVVDLKTTQDASERGFRKAVRNYNYDLTSQLYLRGVSHVLNEPMNEFIHIAVETEKPHGVGLYTLTDSWLRMADQQIDQLLERFAECQAKNEWPSYPDTIQNLDP
jgi:hypothetical protein